MITKFMRANGLLKNGTLEKLGRHAGDREIDALEPTASFRFYAVIDILSF